MSKSVCIACGKPHQKSEMVGMSENKNGHILTYLVCMRCFESHDCTGSLEDGCQACNAYYYYAGK